MKIFKILVCITSLFIAANSFGLVVDKATIKNKATFGIEFEDGTSYYGKGDLFSSVSKQEYMVGTMIVTEVSIDLLGAGTKLRIYNCRTIDSQLAVDSVRGKLPTDLQNKIVVPIGVSNALQKAETVGKNINYQQKVQKIFPTTTNSHTLEFIVNNLDELLDFYDKIASDFTGKPIETDNNKAQKLFPDNGVGGKLYKLGTNDDDTNSESKKSTKDTNKSKK